MEDREGNGLGKGRGQSLDDGGEEKPEMPFHTSNNNFCFRRSESVVGRWIAGNSRVGEACFCIGYPGYTAKMHVFKPRLDYGGSKLGY